MNVNRHIVVATVVILASGVVRNLLARQPITKTVVGGVVFMLILSVLDLFGGPMESLSSALAMLAMLYVLLNTFLPLILGQKLVSG